MNNRIDTTLKRTNDHRCRDTAEKLAADAATLIAATADVVEDEVVEARKPRPSRELGLGQANVRTVQRKTI